MRMTRPATTCAAIGVLFVTMLFTAGAPAHSQQYSLFDKFSVGFGVSSLAFDTQARVDATALPGLGTEIDWEDTLGVSSDEFTPSLFFEWHFGKRHLIFGRWDAVERDGTELVSTELKFGDLTIPINATVTSAFDLDEFMFGYNYYPWVRDRWAAGFGLGIRMIDISLATEITALPGGGQITIASREKAEVDGPMPFLNFDFRYGLTENWRLNTHFGFLDVEIDDFEGSQTVLNATFEHLAWQRFSWAFFFGYSAIDVDVAAADYAGSAKVDILRGGIYGKARW